MHYVSVSRAAAESAPKLCHHGFSAPIRLHLPAGDGCQRITFWENVLEKKKSPHLQDSEHMLIFFFLYD